MWQTLREELAPLGVEIVTVSMELSGPEASRPYIEAANPQHPSLLDPHHQLGALFGVVNIPNVIWIDEQGMIVRPPEPGWPGARTAMPKELLTSLPAMGRAPTAPVRTTPAPDRMALLGSGQDRASYADAIRDWARNGAASRYAMTPDEVVAASQPRSLDTSTAAAHFELANRLWSDGRRELAIAHFNECHRLQPDNWTYKRQAWSLVGHERVGGPFGRWVQAPVAGEEADWPFTSTSPPTSSCSTRASTTRRRCRPTDARARTAVQTRRTGAFGVVTTPSEERPCPCRPPPMPPAPRTPVPPTLRIPTTRATGPTTPLIVTPASPAAIPPRHPAGSEGMDPTEPMAQGRTPMRSAAASG